MTRYGDPKRCPDCLHTIEQGSSSCPSCGLSLTGHLAAQLFVTLSHADELLVALRHPAPAVVGTPTAAPTASTSNPLAARPWVPDPALAPASRGLSAASVPKILLGLGALCLLVAALVFLAVTWSAMGVGGRTATLVGFTAIASGLAGWAATRNLRAAAESLSVVALGLLSFDLFGARESGWLGNVDGPGFAVLLGAVVTVAAGAAGLAVRRTPAGTLYGAELIGVLATATAAVGFVVGDWFPLSATFTAVVVLLALVAFAAHRLRLRALAMGTGIVAALSWLLDVGAAMDRALSHPSLGELWLDLEAWPLLAAAAMVAGLALVRPFPVPLRVAGTAAAELILAAVVLIPFGQGTSTEFTLAVLAVLVAGCLLTWFTPAPWSWGCALTDVVAAAWLVLVGGALASVAVGRVGNAAGALWAGAVDGRLPQPALDGPEPWLLPLVTVAVLATCVLLARSLPLVDRLIVPFADFALGLAVVFASLLGTVVLYPAPVWVPLAMTLLAGVALTTWSLQHAQPVSLALGGAHLVLALALSLYDEWLTAAGLVVALGVAGAVHLRWTTTSVSIAAGGILSATLAGSAWTWGALAEVDYPWTALWALVALGVLVLAVPAAGPRAWRAYRAVPGVTHPVERSALRRFTGVELGALVSGCVLMAVGVGSAPYVSEPTWTAVYLTIAGVVVSLVALLRPDRRSVGWLGGALLATATWVRLWDIGVQAPEAYTVPSAVALAVAGVVHLRRRPGSSTMTALSPSLGLALVPSLLWVLWEPLGPRSVLLGGACLALIVLGVRVRWTAPVVFAGTVGALVVLRQVAPAADAVPQWLLIGFAGTLLVVMGITWERRIQEARAVLGYVRALR